MMIKKYPMKMDPTYKNYIWGGKLLNRDYNKSSPFYKTAESWELSCYDNELSVIENGIFAGQTLKEVLEKNPELIGAENRESKEKFPLLIKLIDANDFLSIQVHPSDKDVNQTKGEKGKAEMWYILDSKEDAYIYMGLKEDIERDALENVFKTGKICEILNKIYVKSGDVFYISPGTIHAIGAGIVIAEIQQNSNITYRIFDYNRRDIDGNTRSLHIKEAIRVCDNKKYKYSNKNAEKIEKTEEYELQKLITCEYFKTFKYSIKTKATIKSNDNSFQALTFIDGNGFIEYQAKNYQIKKGFTYFIPANMGEYQINGSCCCLLVQI